ncbi:type II secretion system protein [Algisphaera agarilytica]|uniref:Prepilin-type N-terminal cleavage/methylation domain-containing protein/prepilin-type processing-associated H-X9-DG protein n=1 Tax=Algisphaera agarilytica TaxID=1385975 RepID=A0A7X0H5R3_9BACT|nr:prepilin-type N-terminal cleavage/methylation domain-containing protein [Algisphaera agarilytica]MBB6429562.1 prepilin-type N-terminal cleavage/methylation domain-containing protein/prepilin-type processing-associated H-X9-DG protein [Algisphaera agarilytica]
MSDRSCLRGGFSLVELLVVMSIIAIMVGFLLPALSKAKSNARAVACANNMRQLGIGFSGFTEDSLGHLYPARQINCGSYDAELAAAGFLGSWIKTTQPYFTAPVQELAKCPSDESPFWTQPTPGFEGMFRLVSYGVNPYASLNGGVVNEPQHAFQTNMYEIAKPSTFVGLGELPQKSPRYAIADYIDTPQLVAAAIHDDDPKEQGLQQAFRSYVGASTHENESPNWLFLDGHVASLARPYVISLPGAVDEAEPLTLPFNDFEWVTNKVHPMVAR